MKTRERYVHSGRFTVSGLVRGLVIGSVVGVGLAFAYAYAILYTPLAGYVTILLTGGFGVFLGLAIGLPLETGKVRNPTLAALAALPVVLGVFYLSWAVWVFAFLRRQGVDAHLPEFVLQPRLLGSVILKINQVGAWKLKGSTPTGGELWFFWSVEALIIIGLGLMGAVGPLDKPFCERCEVWTEEDKDVLALASEDRGALLQRLDADDLADGLRKLGPPAVNAQKSVMLGLHVCPVCKELNALKLETVERVKDRTNRRTVEKYMLLTRAEAEACRNLAKAAAWARNVSAPANQTAAGR